jgi:hypothetical protein
MKKRSSVLLLVIIVLGLNNICSANPLSKIMSFFQIEMVIDVFYKNHKNLIQGSEVYLADDPKGQKILIGKVIKVSLVESQMSKVRVIIDKSYKNKIYETTSFILMGDGFFNNLKAHIVAVSSSETSEKISLKSGSLVKGTTFIEYKISAAEEDLKKVIDGINKNNEGFFAQLDKYIDAFNIEMFLGKMDELINEISQFSAEQKETFRKSILPSLRNMFDLLFEQLNGPQNKEKFDDLDKRIKKIEEIVVV